MTAAYLTRINNDDELTLTPRQRGYTFSVSDVIVGTFADGSARVVRYESSCFGGHGYFDAQGEPVDGELVSWRYASSEEIEAYEMPLVLDIAQEALRLVSGRCEECGEPCQREMYSCGNCYGGDE